MSSRSSITSSTPSTRRPVARRACLSCREKKIKCDGEPPPVPKDQQSGSSEPVSTTNICKNCKFFGTECVFVRSMRGGRRKKRSIASEEDDSNGRLKSFKPGESQLAPSLPGTAITTPSIHGGESSKSFASGGNGFDGTANDRSDLLGYSNFDHRMKRTLSPTSSFVLSSYPFPQRGIGGGSNNSGIIGLGPGLGAINPGDSVSAIGSHPQSHSTGTGTGTGTGNSASAPSNSAPTAGALAPPGIPGASEHPAGDYYDYARHYGGPPPFHMGGMRRYYRRMFGYGPPHHRHGGYGPPPPFPPYPYPPPPHLGYGPHSQPPLPPPPPPPPHGTAPPTSGENHAPDKLFLPPLGMKPEYPDYSEYYKHQQIQQQQIQQQHDQMSQNGKQQSPDNENTGDRQSITSRSVHSVHSHQSQQNPNTTPKSTAIPVQPNSTHSLQRHQEDKESRRQGRSSSQNTPGVGPHRKNGKGLPSEAMDDKSMSSGVDERNMEDLSYEVASGTAFPPSYGHYNAYNKDYYRNSVLKAAQAPVPLTPKIAALKQSLAASTTQEIATASSSYSSSPAPSIDDLLAKVDLPSESTLLYLLDLYYHYSHPEHQIIPKRLVLLNYFPYESNASIYHAIISVVARFNNKVSTDESTWISNVQKHWDNLNTLQMLLCCTLMLKTNTYGFHYQLAMNLTKKIWGIIKYNKLTECYKQIPAQDYPDFLESVTTRQLFDREIMVRMLWDFFIHRIIIFRVKIGYPYDKIGSINSTQRIKTFNAEFETNYYSDYLELPIDNEKYLKDIRSVNVEDRLVWVDIHKQISKIAEDSGTDVSSISSKVDSQLSDSVLFILSTTLMDMAADTVSRNGLLKTNLVKLESSIEKLEKVLPQRKAFTLTKDNRMYLNITSVSTLFILKSVKMVTNLLFLDDIVVFKPYLKIDDIVNAEFMPVINDVKLLVLPDLQVLTQSIASLSIFQWKCFITMISSCLEVIKIIELGEGLVPENFAYWDNPSYENQKTYKVRAGITGNGDTNSNTWWDAEDVEKPFVTSSSEQPDAWLQYPDIGVMAAGALVGALASLTVLSQYVKFVKPSPSIDEADENEIFVDAILELPGSTELKRIEKLDVQHQIIANQLFDEFKTNYLLEKFSTTINFIKARVKYGHDVEKDLLVKAERINHYIEEILTTQSGQK